jgi:integrase
MARVKDLWFSEVKDPDDPTGRHKIRKRTARHPDHGGSKDAKRWLAVWIGPDGKEATKAFHVRDKAKKYARQQEEDVERGEYIDQKAGRELISSVGRKWLRLRNIGGASRVTYEQVWRLHVEPAFGHRQVKSVRPSEVAEWLVALSKTRGTTVQDHAIFILRGVFALAVADGMRKDNPAKSDVVAAPRVDDTEDDDRVWHSDTVRAVVAAHPVEYRAIPTLLAGCGLRESEAFGLALEDFDFDAGKVRIRRQVCRVGKRSVFKAPKGGRERWAPLSLGVARAVRDHIDRYPPRPYALPWMKENGEVEAEEHQCKLLFRWHSTDPRSNDRHILARAYGPGVWLPALAEAGVIPMPAPGPRGGRTKHYPSAGRGNGTHALRHWCSTTLQDRGVPLGAVMDFLGHSRRNQRRVPITIRVYSHTTEAAFEAARNAIDRSLFPLRPVEDHRPSGTEAEQAATR